MLKSFEVTKNMEGGGGGIPRMAGVDEQVGVNFIWINWLG